MPLPKLKNSLSMKLALDSVLQIRELVFQLWQLHPKKLSKTISETSSKWSRFGPVSETWGLANFQPILGIKLLASRYAGSVRQPPLVLASSSTLANVPSSRDRCYNTFLAQTCLASLITFAQPTLSGTPYNDYELFEQQNLRQGILYGFEMGHFRPHFRCRFITIKRK